MSSKDLLGTKVAVLVASGFEERNLTYIQKIIQERGGAIKVISPNQGLVNGWDGENWGHNYAVDASLNTALGIDYHYLIIPGGHKSIDKLKLTAHSRRFIGSFIAAMKPVVALGDALSLMGETEFLKDRTVTGPENLKELVKNSGAKWSSEEICIDGQLITGVYKEELKDEYASKIIDIFIHNIELDQAA